MYNYALKCILNFQWIDIIQLDVVRGLVELVDMDCASKVSEFLVHSSPCEKWN